MLTTIALTLSLLNSPQFWQITRSVIWGMSHDHHSVNRKESDLEACRYILGPKLAPTRCR